MSAIPTTGAYWYDRAHAAESALAAAVAQAETLRQALAEADKLASEAHDAIWNEAVQPNGWLHDGADPGSASQCIHRLHAIARAALSVSPSQGRVLTDEECETVSNALIVAGTQLPLPLNSEARRDVEAALDLLVPARAGGRA